MTELLPTLGHTSEGVEVRIRTDEYSSEESLYLCNVPFTVLENLVLQVGRWGVYVDGRFLNNAAGQFTIGDRGCFFEIVLDTEVDA